MPEAQSQPAASVLLVRARAAPELVEQARELVAGAVPGLAVAAVRVVQTQRAEPAPAPPQFARIGPITVARSSAGMLRAWLIGSLLVHIGLASALLLPLVRKRG